MLARWHFVKRNLFNCSALLTTDLLINNPLMVKNHSLSADFDEISNKATITDKIHHRRLLKE
ncbi:Uncharacterized protein FWK35_00035091 [Aphis craccivora]|uniref:Uncharacterized protein n=1 Tax=Aphis craccivora TaxID=307492 RepID=A0A6G0VRS9_APHCR|nr:Uncharacterized protein FWK35_00035091 [Aphis craccivora]